MKMKQLQKNKLTNKYKIVTPDQWVKIVVENRQSEYEIIEEL